MNESQPSTLALSASGSGLFSGIDVMKSSGGNIGAYCLGGTKKDSVGLSGAFWLFVAAFA